MCERPFDAQIKQQVNRMNGPETAQLLLASLLVF